MNKQRVTEIVSALAESQWNNGDLKPKLEAEIAASDLDPELLDTVLRLVKAAFFSGFANALKWAHQEED